MGPGPVTEFEIWPDRTLPLGAREFAPEEIQKLLSQQTKERIRFVEFPSLTVYQPPADKANGCAVVIAPGGSLIRIFNVRGEQCYKMGYNVR